MSDCSESSQGGVFVECCQERVMTRRVAPCVTQAARKLAITEVDLERAEARLEAAEA